MKRFLCVVGMMLGLAGCAATGENPKDPYESFNRTMYSVNASIDTVAKPIAQGYDAVVPRPLRVLIGNFLGNLGDIWIAINNFLQGKPADGFSDVGRVLVNTTIGFCGIFDFASEMGLDKHSEDLGQTLAVWGVGSGPYLFIPVMGPSTLRDIAGSGVEMNYSALSFVDDVRARNTIIGLYVLEGRARLLAAESLLENAAFDEYTYIRDMYLRAREAAIKDED